MTMARPAAPIAEKNPFLTSKSLAPANNPSHQYNTDEHEESEDEQEGSECSEESEESEYAVDQTVREEMDRLENTFRELGMKFRMIARIGEGTARILVFLVYHSNDVLTGLSRHFLNCLQGRRLTLRILSERLGPRTKGRFEMDISSVQEEKECINLGHQPRSTPPA